MIRRFPVWAQRGTPPAPRLSIACLAGALLLLASAGRIAAAAELQERPTADSSRAAFRVSTATSVVNLWQEHQKLYVKGDVGVGQPQLDALEVWLDEHGPHWTVVLTENAAGEDYTDADGTRYTGMDAVDMALGKGLANRTGFGTLTHPKTGERDGAFFVLYLKERKFSYFASDAQDKRRLGEDYWEGNLDGPAIAAMRSGGRAVDAVKDTILNINRRLDQRIASEIAQRERRALAEAADREKRAAAEKAARARAEAEAKGNLETAARALTVLEQKLGDFLRSRTEMSGDLASSDLARFQADLAAARVASQSGNFSGVARMAADARDRIQAQIRLLEKHEADAAEIGRLEAALTAAAKRLHSRAAQAELRAAQEALARARAEHERGDSSYVVYLSNGQNSLAKAKFAIAAAARTARLVRGFVLVIATGSAGTLLIVGLLLNRRRKPDMDIAVQLLRDWETALGEKTVALFQLRDRMGSVLGRSADVMRARFRGETLNLAQEIVRDVDELFIMSACAGRVLRETQDWVQPSNRRERLRNLVAAGSYRAAVRRLRDEPVVFRPEEALELVVRGPRTERDTLIGELESYSPFTMSFGDLIKTFNEQARHALELLDLVETSLVQAGRRLEAVQKSINAVRRRESVTAGAAAADGLFPLTTVFNELIPAAQASLDQAVKISISDAVGALRTHGAEAEQRARDASALVEWAAGLRNDPLPEMLAAANTLQAAEISSAWIAEEVRDLSARAEAAGRNALQGDASEALAALRTGAQELAARVRQALVLDKEWRESAAKAIVDASALIASARNEIGAALRQDPVLILREEDADPSEAMEKASQQIAATKAALERGDVVGARQSLDAVMQWSQVATDLVNETRQALAAHPGTLAERTAENERLIQLLPEHEQILAKLQRDYAPSVLILGEGDPTHPNANGTVQDNLEEARTHLKAAQDCIDAAVKAYDAARLLEAAGLFRQTQALQEMAAVRLQEIKEKEERLRQAEQNNATLRARLEDRLHQLAALGENPQIMSPTLDLIQGQSAQFALLQEGMRAACPDPFGIAARLRELEAALNLSTQRIQSDRELFAEAERGLSSASAQLDRAVQLARQAASDQVPDSPEIIQARSALDPLAPRLASAQQALRRPHNDWTAVAAESETIAAEASRLGATLAGELREAEAAVEALTSATAALRQAGLWTGAYGVAIASNPGAAELAVAREQIHRGSYRAGQQAAELARRAAEQAIALAQAEVQRRQRDEQERLERQRRQRMAMETARRHSASRASSGFGGGLSSRRSGFSSGSGVRRSSFSSGSGARRSGW